MELTLRVDRKGQQPGTLGWLCANAASIKIGMTKGGNNRGAWLMDKEGETVTPLAIAGFVDCYIPEEPVTKVARYENPVNLYTGRVWTDAAWAVIEELAEQAVELLNEPVERAESVKITLEA